MKKKIPEVRYRASRVCRVLGNPTAYEVVHLLKNKKRTARELSDILGVAVPTVSEVLRSLRQIDLIRYEVKWRKRVYWLKYRDVTTLLGMLERLIRKIGVKEI